MNLLSSLWHYHRNMSAIRYVACDYNNDNDYIYYCHDIYVDKYVTC